MKIYFLKTDGNNQVIFTEEDTAKVFDAAPTGIFEGVDLYSSNAEKELKETFIKLYQNGELNDFTEIYCKDEMSLRDLAEVLESAVLVFDKNEFL